uniref:Uncharacterized protein n=1 Tax=Ignavibacterium album TaxID=591197 RepID=A0A832DNN0_9BACT
MKKSKIQSYIILILFSGIIIPQTKVNSWGFDAYYRNNEYTLSVVVLEFSFNRYKIVSPYLNFSILLNDKKNGYEPAYSFMGVYSFIPLTIFGFAGDFGSSGTIIAAIAAAPLLVTNSQHHFIITNVDTTSVSPIELSIFVQNRSDYYQERWLRMNPGLGVSLSFNEQSNGEQENPKSLPIRNTKSLSISFGIEKPIDIYKFNFEELELRYFVNIYKFF